MGPNPGRRVTMRRSRGTTSRESLDDVVMSWRKKRGHFSRVSLYSTLSSPARLSPGRVARPPECRSPLLPRPRLVAPPRHCDSWPPSSLADQPPLSPKNPQFPQYRALYTRQTTKDILNPSRRHKKQKKRRSLIACCCRAPTRIGKHTRTQNAPWRGFSSHRPPAWMNLFPKGWMKKKNASKRKRWVHAYRGRYKPDKRATNLD